MRPKVSIVIPVRNGEKWILAAVKSALSQQWTADDGMPELYEVIVRDDCSSDGTIKALEGVSDARLTIVQGSLHLSLGESFRDTFAMANAEFVVVMGCDDQIDPNYLERVMKEFAPGVAMVGCHPRFIDENFQPYTNEADPRLKIAKPTNVPKERWLEILNIGNMYFGINTYRKKAVLDVGGFDPRAGWLLDWDLYVRLIKRFSIKVIEEELCSLMLRSDTISCLQKKDLPDQHRYSRYVREKNFRPDKMKVALATPFYMSQELSHYGESLTHTCVMLTQAGIPWELIRINGDSYVDRAKNTICANFLESDCTDLIMIDSDEQWHPIAISRLLQHPEEIVAAAYPFKNNWGRFAGNPLVKTVNGKDEYAGWRELSDGSCLLEAYNIAGGFTRIKRSALEKYAEAYPNDIYVDQFAWPQRSGRIYTAFFLCDIVDYERYGEDAYFSRRMREIGIKLWIDPNITITHYGMHGWTGNFHQSILKPPEEIERLMAERKTLEEAHAKTVAENVSFGGAEPDSGQRAIKVA